MSGQSKTKIHRAELVHNFTEQKIEVLGIQEHCIIHDDPVKHENIQGKTLVTSSAWRNDAGAATGGVGVLLNSHATKCVTDVRNHTERILVINFSGNPAATVISTYSPTNAAPEDEVQQYYDNLCRAVESVPAHNVLIITGDFNARLGKEHVNFPFHEETNRNGEYLADFIQEKGLISANTKFQKNKSRQWTYMSPQGLKYQLDYIPVRKKWQNSITDAWAYNSFVSVGSDHHVVSASIHLSLRVNCKAQPKRVRYEWKALIDNSVMQERYTASIQNKFQILENTEETATEKYGRFIKANSETAAELIPEVRKKRKPKHSDDHRVMQAREKVQQALQKYLQSLEEDDRVELEKYKRDLSSVYKSLKEEELNIKLSEVEVARRNNNHRVSW